MSVATAQAAATLAHDFAAWDNVIRRKVNDNVPGGFAYLATRDGEIVASGVGGYARAPWEGGDSGVRWTLQTPMAVASVSKSITGTSLVKLWELKNKSFSFDDPFWGFVASRLPNVDPSVKRITLRHLLNHTSGLTVDYADPVSFEASLKKVVSWEPGSKAQYNNGNFYLIQLVIEAITGQPLETFTKEHLLVPSGVQTMNSKAVGSEPTLGYAISFAQPHGVLFSYPSTQLGFGGWWASVEDLTRFLGGLRTNKTLETASVQMMSTQGYGWYPISVGGKVVGYGHNGGYGAGEGAVGSYQARFNDGIDAALLINSDAADPVSLLVEAWQKQAATETKPANRAPILNAVSPVAMLLGSIILELPFEKLVRAADAHDLDGDTLSLRIGSVTAGTLAKGGVAVTAGMAMGPSETLAWIPPSDAIGIVPAFTFRASDGRLDSAAESEARIDLATGDVTQPGDPIIAIPPNQSPSSEGVSNAIDNSSGTKYLNTVKLNCGFAVTPSVGATIVTGVRLTSANDVPTRDPAEFILSGSNDNGATFKQIAQRPVPTFAARFAAQTISFTNSASYQAYRLIFSKLQGGSGADFFQIAEVELLGALSGRAQPAARAQAVRTFVNRPVSVELSAEGGNGVPLTYALVTAPSHGRISGDAPHLKYVPEDNFSGPDSFSFKASAGGVDSLAATITIQIAGDAPQAQTIDFEILPDGSMPTDRMTISNQFSQAFGVSFEFEDGTFPHIAEVGAPLTAFYGPPRNGTSGATIDRAADGESIGRFFLTDTDVAGKPGLRPPPPLLIHYSRPVAAANGVILDIDHDDAWEIQAFNTNQKDPLAVVRLDAANPNAGDGLATPWSFSRPSAEIDSIRIVFTGTSETPGLAFDNFSPAVALPVPEPARLGLRLSPKSASLTVTGTVLAMYKIEFAGSISNSTWTTFTNIYLPSSPFTLIDSGMTNSPSRFYRAIGLH